MLKSMLGPVGLLHWHVQACLPRSDVPCNESPEDQSVDIHVGFRKILLQLCTAASSVHCCGFWCKPSTSTIRPKGGTSKQEHQQTCNDERRPGGHDCQEGVCVDWPGLHQDGEGQWPGQAVVCRAQDCVGRRGI